MTHTGLRSAQALGATTSHRHPKDAVSLSSTSTPPCKEGAPTCRISDEDQSHLPDACSSAPSRLDSGSPSPECGESHSPAFDARPPHSYSALIKHALAQSPHEQMSFREICHSIEERFDYYRNMGSPSWKVSTFVHRSRSGLTTPPWPKASLRNHLSRSSEFKNVDRRDGEGGRGRLWELDRSFKLGVLNKRYSRRHRVAKT